MNLFLHRQLNLFELLSLFFYCSGINIPIGASVNITDILLLYVLLLAFFLFSAFQNPTVNKSFLKKGLMVIFFFAAVLIWLIFFYKKLKKWIMACIMAQIFAFFQQNPSWNIYFPVVKKYFKTNWNKWFPPEIDYLFAGFLGFFVFFGLWNCMYFLGKCTAFFLLKEWF